MTVLVTGSEGSLMQWVLKNLLADGREVIGVDNHARYDDYEHTKIADPDDYEFRNVDLTDPVATADVVSDVDSVINAAALIYGVKGFHEYPADILSNDVTIHRNILEAAANHGVDRVGYISSSMVYEQTDPPHHEPDVWEGQVPSTDYGLSKVVGERYSKAFAEQYDVTYTVWRPFNIITPHEQAEDEPGMSHVFADFIHKILVEQQNPMEIFGDGEQIRCFTWIDEVASAIATQTFTPETANEAYNLANPEPVTMKELARRIFVKASERGLVEGESLSFDHRPIYDDDVKERIPSVEKATDQFGWNPGVTLDDALDICLDNAVETYEL